MQVKPDKPIFTLVFYITVLINNLIGVTFLGMSFLNGPPDAVPLMNLVKLVLIICSLCALLTFGIVHFFKWLGVLIPIRPIYFALIQLALHVVGYTIIWLIVFWGFWNEG